MRYHRDSIKASSYYYDTRLLAYSRSARAAAQNSDVYPLSPYRLAPIWQSESLRHFRLVDDYVAKQSRLDAAGQLIFTEKYDMTSVRL